MQPAAHAHEGNNTALDLLRRLQREHPELLIRAGGPEDAVDGLVPAAVAVPRTAEHVAAVLRAAHAARLTVVPCGGGTQMAWGGVLQRADVVLQLGALRRIVDYQPAEMTVTVEAGCPLSELQRALAQHRQFLPVDPPLAEEATVGGIVATNAAGPLRLAYGTLRDYVLGLRAVRADGTVVKTGGRVVKNAAGYDLGKVFTGSFGTLAVLTEITLLVRPLPAAHGMVYVPLPRVEAIEPLVATLLDAPLEPVLLEVFNADAAARFAADALPAGADAAPYGLLVGFAGSQAAVRWQVEHTLELIAALPAPAKEKLRGQAVSWEPVYSALLSARRPATGTAVCRASLLSSEIASFLDRAEKALRAHQLRAPVFAHAGSGIVHVHCDASAPALPSLVGALREAARTVGPVPAVPALNAAGPGNAAPWAAEPALVVPGLGDLEGLRKLAAGSLILESGPRAVRQAIAVYDTPAGHHALSAALRRQLDPEGILNPGRMAP